MAIGSLRAKVVLDEPQRTYCGHSQPVTGKIVLSFMPNPKAVTDGNSSELFGPMRLAVRFHGRAKSKIWKKQGNTTHIYRGRAPLFQITQRIYDDAFRCPPGESRSFPFQISFPEAVGATQGDWAADGRFACKPGDPLPPSFRSEYRGFAHHYESFVEYRVGVDVAMSRLQVDITKPGKYEEPLVRYEPPRKFILASARPYNLSDYVAVKNELLLPEADRPTGFKQKAKAAFSSDYFPTYSFDWTCVAPRDLILGQPAVFEVRIRPREQECTAPLIPDVRLTSFNATIVAHTQVRAEKQFFSSPESSSDESILSLRSVVDDAGPFSKARDWTKAVNTSELSRISSTFHTYNISQSYGMKVKLQFRLAGKTKDFSREFSITVHPPLQANQASAAPLAATAGSSRVATEMSDMASALPQYEHPPEYDRPTEEPLQPVSQHEQSKIAVY